MLMVAMPETPGQPPPPEVTEEQALLRTLFPAAVLTVCMPPKATRAVVREDLRRHAWVHVSCHGTQDQDGPASGGLRLVDGMLTVQQTRRPPVGLLGFGLVKGRSDVSQPASAWALAVGALLAVALVCGGSGALRLTRAGHGLPTVTPVSPLRSQLAADHEEALRAAADLRWGIRATLCCAGLLVIAVSTACEQDG